MSEQNIVSLPENLDRTWAGSFRPPFQRSDPLILDFTRTRRMDSAAACFIRLLHASQKKKNRKEVLRNIAPVLLSSLQSAPEPAERGVKDSGPPPSFFVRMGTVFLAARETTVNALSVLVEMLYWGSFGLLKKQEFRKGSLGDQMFLIGYKAFGIVGLLSFLIGMVLALQAAIQLKIYGAAIFLGPLIGITMVREMGPLLTAVILAGRTGSATTAEIGTMVVGEEIDALRTMGINPVQFVAVPKFWAMTITMPVLNILSTMAGIVGGFCVAITYLDLASNLYWGELWKNLYFKDVLAGFIKSVVFSWLIIWIGTFYGFQVHGGAESVGRKTTASVVACIFIIIITDALFSFVL